MTAVARVRTTPGVALSKEKLAGAAGMAATIIAWQAVAVSGIVGESIAPPTEVATVLLGSEEGPRIWTATTETALASLAGFGWGVAVAAIVGVMAIAVPILRRGIGSAATAQSAMPFVALGPILLAVFDRETVPTAMSAATCFFTLYMAIVSGLGAAPKGLDEVFVVFGASRWQRLARVQLPASLPLVASGIKIALPLSVVGAVIGEWFGASAGVGPILLSSLRDYEMHVMWSAATSTVILALCLFGIAALFERAAQGRFGS